VEHSDTIRPRTPPRPIAGQGLDWYRPVGYGHAANVLALLTNRPVE